MKRLPLSLNIAPASKAALLARAAREGHRYPAVLAATLLERALQGEDEGGAGADPNVVANVAVKLTACAQKLRARGAVPADRVESLASALDELAGRLGGSVGAAEDEHEASLSPTSRAALPDRGEIVPMDEPCPREARTWYPNVRDCGAVGRCRAKPVSCVLHGGPEMYTDDEKIAERIRGDVRP